MEHLKCSNKRAVGLLRELEEKAGLIERRRQGLGRPSVIYVKNIVADIVPSHTVENVAFMGCGVSKALLCSSKYFLAHNAKKLWAYHFTAKEFNTDTPAWLGERTIVITASLGDTTPKTVRANAVAQEGLQLPALPMQQALLCPDYRCKCIKNGSNWALKEHSQSFARYIILLQHCDKALYEKKRAGLKPMGTSFLIISERKGGRTIGCKMESCRQPMEKSGT